MKWRPRENGRYSDEVEIAILKHACQSLESRFNTVAHLLVCSDRHDDPSVLLRSSSLALADIYAS